MIIGQQRLGQVNIATGKDKDACARFWNQDWKCIWAEKRPISMHFIHFCAKEGVMSDNQIVTGIDVLYV